MITGALVSMLADRLTGAVGEFFKVKAAAARDQVKMRSNAVKNGIPGWSDEWLVLIWSMPMVSAFVPGLREQAAAGFSSLQAFPDWYIGGFFTVTAAVFGIDKWLKFKK